jgi:hypothetical protein
MINEPSVEEYRKAFAKIWPKLTSIQKEMLKLNMGSELTAGEMAQRVGYKSYSATCTHYGKLAHMVYDALDKKFERKGPYWVEVLCEDGGKQKVTGYYLWAMRDNVKKALEIIFGMKE